MYDLRPTGYPGFNDRMPDPHDTEGVRAVRRATSQYEWALWRAQLWRTWALLTQRPNRLRELAAEQGRCVTGVHGAGLQTVEIRRIVGSEGRSRDFDRRFLPLRKYTRERWISVAVARETGICLPPVTLIQMGDRYYVRDGHHRISVRAADGAAVH